MNHQQLIGPGTWPRHCRPRASARMRRRTSNGSKADCPRTAWRSSVPAAPDGIATIGAGRDAEGTTGTLFRSPGVERVDEMTLADGVWKLWRSASAPGFSQRSTGTFDRPGHDLGTWELSHDGSTWEMTSTSCTREPRDQRRPVRAEPGVPNRRVDRISRRPESDVEPGVEAVVVLSQPSVVTPAPVQPAADAGRRYRRSHGEDVRRMQQAGARRDSTPSP